MAGGRASVSGFDKGNHVRKIFFKIDILLHLHTHARTHARTDARKGGTCLNILARDTYLFLAEAPLKILHSCMRLHVRILDCACGVMSW